ncbi:hypothetical protein ACLKA7_013787 [Drosophila subpalustris]
MRNKAWEVLLSKYHEEDPDAAVEDVKKKINSLRASYRRELRKIALSETGKGEADYKPQIWYFDELDFLRQQETQGEGSTIFDDRPTETETRRSTKRKHNDNNEVTFFDDDSSEIETQRSSKRKNESAESLEEPLLYLEADNHKRARDDADVFAEGWAIIFRQLSKDQQIFAKRGIDELLMQGQLGMLTYASV